MGWGLGTSYMTSTQLRQNTRNIRLWYKSKIIGFLLKLKENSSLKCFIYHKINLCFAFQVEHFNYSNVDVKKSLWVKLGIICSLPHKLEWAISSVYCTLGLAGGLSNKSFVRTQKLRQLMSSLFNLQEKHSQFTIQNGIYKVSPISPCP